MTNGVRASHSPPANCHPSLLVHIAPLQMQRSESRWLIDISDKKKHRWHEADRGRCGRAKEGGEERERERERDGCPSSGKRNLEQASALSH